MAIFAAQRPNIMQKSQKRSFVDAVETADQVLMRV
jgi:hypothetical protein